MMNEQSAIMGRKKKEAIAALMLHPSIAKAAQSIGIERRTLAKWLREKTFQREYMDARHEVFSQAITWLQANAIKAAKILMEIAENKKATASARVSAARSILEFGRQGVELDDLAMKIMEIEDRLNEEK